MPIPQDDPLRCGLAWSAKVCASGQVHTDRDPALVFGESCNWMAASDEIVRGAIERGEIGPLLDLAPEISHEPDAERWTFTLDGRTAHVRRFGEQGVAVVGDPEEGPRFTPTPVPRQVAAGVHSPLDDPSVVADPGATGARVDKLAEAEELLFGRPEQMTNAVIVMHRGEILLERYRDPFDAETRFESWSMGKTIAATLFGVAQQQGLVSLDETALFDAWSSGDDPRREIRARDLLNMASGLDFTGSYGRSEDPSRKSEAGRFLDHVYVYAGGVDSHTFCLEKPLADPPGTSGRYRNCDPLLIMGLLRERACAGDVDEFLTWPYEALLNRIGANGMVLETDPFGHFLISGHDYGRARDWARLGQLHLQRGAWGGEQLFSEEYAEFVRTPARHAWDTAHCYGAFAYLNEDGVLPTLPPDAFLMSGGGRQRTVIVPSLDLVLVRLGHINGQVFGIEDTLNQAYAAIVAAVESA
ncbi:MAG: serine hydrolase [Actinomycetota bacterium]